MPRRNIDDWRDPTGYGVYHNRSYDGTPKGRRAAIRATRDEERRNSRALWESRRKLGELAYQRALRLPGHIVRTLGRVAAESRDSIVKLKPEPVVRPKRLSIPDDRITGGPELLGAINRQTALATMLSAKSVDPRSGAIKVPFWRPEEVGLNPAHSPNQTNVTWTDRDEGNYLSIRAQATPNIARGSLIGVEVNGPRRSRITTFSVTTGYNQVTKASVHGDKIVDFDIVYLDKNDRERSLLSSADRRRACTPENGTGFAVLAEVAQATGYATQDTVVYPMDA